ncbi:TerB family tellurite resistance protein [Rhizobiaceae bacterium n13]|uniref:TerB family tellurite resistance protein n=1 Tax=Ferirhizobium litorale TaxID=2927786 RepID=A0AAE3QGW0_9HYPH|nr:TerB family tellurite resistance protein [Fererhizobium litorale]MDI7862450.1 TerB family tellurite resistance protein [Fererhizobium litorale]MDI7923663.1 TerB family tellurite resistance protein [Fererhizobium litorale]
MFERFQSFLQTLKSRPGSDFAPDDSRIAVAALCFQVMEADGNISAAEKERLRVLLRDHYQLDESRLEALIAAGQEAGQSAVDYYRFTNDLKRQLDEAQRIELLGILWDIVYADGTRSEMEDHVIWRIADLLGVSGRDRVISRQQAAARASGVEIGDIDAD